MKYVGSKARLARELLSIILKDHSSGDVYVEPFAGGMNVVCKVPGDRIANDNNYYLVAMWRALLDGWSPPLISRQEYTDIRDNKESYPDHLVGWVGFNCSYSGKWFAGFAGEIITRTGVSRNYQIEAIKNVKAQIPGLRGATLVCGSYLDLQIPTGSTIYCDIPYQGVTGYPSKFDHLLFWDWAREMDRLGNRVFVSEYQAPPDFVCVWEKPVKSSLSANGQYGGSKASTERLFRYDPT